MSERNYERINDLPEGITPVTGAELVELEQDGVSRKFSMTALAGITNPHEETHQRGGSDEIGTLDNVEYGIPYLDADGVIDTRVSDASTTKKGKVQLAASGEVSATKAVTGTDARLSDARAPTPHASQHIAGTDVIADATVSNSGLMSATDKVKADATIPENIPTADQKAALVGTYGTPSETNRYVTEQDPILGGMGGSGAVGGNTLIGVGALGTELLVDGVGIGYAGMARLSENLIAFFHKDVGELRTYQRSGATWSQVGSGLTISGAMDAAMAAYSSTRIIFIDSGNKELRSYLWSGSAWSLFGTSLSIAGLGTPSITVLSSTKIALIDSGNKELRTYELSGTEWSLVGTSFSIPGLGTPSIISLGLNEVALLDSGMGLLSKYRNLSNIWTKIGNSTAIYNGGALARLNATDISVVNNYSAGNSVIMAYRWVDTIYERLEKDFFISGDFITTVPLDLNEIALFDATTDKLRNYSFLFGYDSASINISADYEVTEIDNGKSIIVRRTSAYDGNPVTITPPSGATFEGRASIDLYGQYSYVELERISATVFAIKDEKSLASFIAPVDCTSRVAEYTGDGGGATVKDRAGNGNNLTATDITYVNGKYGKEMSFNGTTSYAQASSPVIGTTGTVAVRFKRGAVGENHNLFSNFTDTSNGLILRFQSADEIQLYTHGTGGSTSYMLKSSFTDISDYHSGILRITGSQIIFMLDGVDYTFAQTSEMVAGLANLTLGRRAVPTSGYDYFFNGIISHFRYDSRIWTADEARAWSLNPISIDSRV